MRSRLAAFLLLAVPATTAVAQAPAATARVTAADYGRAERLLAPRVSPLVSGVVTAPRWLADERVTYRVRNAAGAQVTMLVDARTGARIDCTAEPARCPGVSTTPAAPGAGAPRGARASESVSPDGKRAVFIRDWNLWVRDVATNAETQLTTDGVKDFGYATDNAGWTAQRPPDRHLVARLEEDRDLPAGPARASAR